MARLDDPASFNGNSARHRYRYSSRRRPDAFGSERQSQHDYYDPDHEYRSRRYWRDMDHEASDAGHDRPATRYQPGDDRTWGLPPSWHGGGRYRGIGPKGYVRSDDRIREAVSDELMDDSWLDASQIEVAVQDGEVTLSGTVEDRDAKRLAEDIAEHASGVKHVQNNLRVLVPCEDVDSLVTLVQNRPVFAHSVVVPTSQQRHVRSAAQCDVRNHQDGASH